MHWMTKLGESLRAEISRRAWRSRLSGDDLAWTHQLAWQSVEFTQALGLQWSLSNDRMLRDVHAEHVVEEANHPSQLRAWMDHEQLLLEAPFLGVPPTDATTVLTSFNTRVALREPLAVRVGVLNVLGEGVALDTFTAMIDALSSAGRLGPHAKFWRIHKAVDGDHLKLGLSELGHIDENSALGRDVSRMMRLGGRLYGDMLDSWVIEPARL
jgi:hypothetical protein